MATGTDESGTQAPAAGTGNPNAGAHDRPAADLLKDFATAQRPRHGARQRYGVVSPFVDRPRARASAEAPIAEDPAARAHCADTEDGERA